MADIDLLQQASFERLLARYERIFGGAPPLAAATLDEAVGYMRARLAAHARPRLVTATSPPVAANRNGGEARSAVG